MTLLATAPLAAPSKRQWSARRIADAAVRALCEEAMLTPKPGLVDRRGSGAHRDMDMAMLLRSAITLRLTFEKIARCASSLQPGTKLRQRLAQIGIDGERDMLAATGGVNTHRGAIWSLGLIGAARSALPGATHAEELCAYAGRIARIPITAATFNSHGRAMQERFGVRGARGEAEDGFPHVYKVALPVLRDARALGHDENHARLRALLALMAVVDDTCLLYRGGRRALTVAQNGARRVLELEPGSPAGKAALQQLDDELVGLRASPGGCADLLAATLLVDTFTPAAEQL